MRDALGNPSGSVYQCNKCGEAGVTLTHKCSAWAKADQIQKAGTEMAKFGCMLMIVIPLGLLLIAVIAGLLFG